MKRIISFIFISFLFFNLDASLKRKTGRRKGKKPAAGLSPLKKRPLSLKKTIDEPEVIKDTELFVLDLDKQLNESDKNFKDFEIKVKSFLDMYTSPVVKFNYDIGIQTYDGIKKNIFERYNIDTLVKFTRYIINQLINYHMEILKKGGLDDYIIKFDDNIRQRKVTYGYIEKEDLVQDSNSNFIIIGDLHGDFDSFNKIIENLIQRGVLTDKLGLNENYKIIFLGDYVDRGPDSLEISLIIFLLKAINRDKVILLRGNHEDVKVFKLYGFSAELLNKLYESDLLRVLDEGFKDFNRIHELFLGRSKLIETFNSISEKYNDDELVIYLVSRLRLLNENFKKKQEYFKNTKKALNYFNNKFAAMFYLLPGGYFLKNSKQNIFQFSHAGYDFFTDKDDLFFKSNKRFQQKDITNLLWNDISLDPNLNDSMASGRGLGLLCPIKRVFEDMKKNNIIAKFGGHQHELAKMFKFNEEQALNKLKELFAQYSFNEFVEIFKDDNFTNILINAEVDFFNNLNDEFKENKPIEELKKLPLNILIDNLNEFYFKSLLKIFYLMNINTGFDFGAVVYQDINFDAYFFILISGIIKNKTYDYLYYPSYLELKLDNKKWSVDGYALGEDVEIYKLK
ncbi:MAG: metallophosphoesterase family protein [bacterium]